MRSRPARPVLIASLDVRVEPLDALRLRRAIVRAGGNGLETIKVTRIDGSSRLCVSVAMHLEAFATVMSAILSAVPNGEFVRPARHLMTDALK